MPISMSVNHSSLRDSVFIDLNNFNLQPHSLNPPLWVAMAVIYAAPRTSFVDHSSFPDYSLMATVPCHLATTYNR